jgi:2,3-bisphosphoglycerate-independent phosphoglycerate mutase
MTSGLEPARRHVLLFFIDGVGVGEDDPEINPLATGRYPALHLTRTRTPNPRAGIPTRAGGIDACLGIPGLPQSATGQTSILTGVNAPALLGRHASGFPGPTLRRVLAEHSLLKRLAERGLTPTFLNAFGPRFFEDSETARRLSATTLATIASGVRIRDWEDLAEGRAVVHDLTHWRMREYGYDLPLRSAEEAGAIIAREAMKVDFALFEYFETDRAGHAQDRAAAERCLSDLNAALETVVETVDRERTLVVVASDHGNLEDSRVKTHTMNAAFFAIWGPSDGLPSTGSLVDLAPLIEAALLPSA